MKGVWRLVKFYGCPKRSRRRESWDLICTLQGNSSSPWCILGEFNDIISAMDKKGLIDHPTWLINDLHDIPLEGLPIYVAA